MSQDFPQILIVDGVDYSNSVQSLNVVEPDLTRLDHYGGKVFVFQGLPLVCTADLAIHLRQKLANYGPLAESTFTYSRYNAAKGSYENITGRVDYLTLLDVPVGDIAAKGVQVNLQPDDEYVALQEKDQITTNILKRKDFDGASITAFANETHSVQLTAVNIPNRPETGGTTSCEMVLIWEVFLRLFQKITGRNDCFRSSILGRTDGEVFTYGVDGEWAFIAFSSEQLVRQGSSVDYGIKTNLREVFDFLYHQENVMLGIEEQNGALYFVLEKEEYFRDSSNVVATITEPNVAEFYTDPEKLYSRVLAGYRTFSSTQDVGNLGGFLYTAWTQRSYVTPMHKFLDNTYNIRTDVIVDPYLIQVVKETPISDDSGSTLTDRIFAFWLKRKSGGFELDQDYTSSGFNNPGTLYNLKFLPSRGLEKHLPILAQATKLAFDYRQANEPGFSGITLCQFEDGEGAVSVSTQLTGETTAITENEDKPHSGVEPICLPNVLYVEHPLSEEEKQLIRDNDKQLVRVTVEGVSKDYFIEEFMPREEGVTMVLKERNQDYTS